MTHLTRRDLLKTGAALPLVSVPVVAAPRPADGVRNIIFMVSDGMSAGVPSLAEPFSHLVRGAGTRWHGLADDPGTVRGFLETASLDSMVTDSAAASSAWGTGSRVNNGSVNMLPDGTRLTPIAQLAKGAGRAVGLVTTTTITHATPAGFAAVEASRDDQAGIASQYRGVVDVLLGGGVEHFEPAHRADGRDVIGEYRAKGYSLCFTRDDLGGLPRQAPLLPVLGLFGVGHLPFTVDQVNRPELHRDVPTLEEMTRFALDRLVHAPNGFLLQVEGGRVDHAAHGNDPAGLLWDQLAFDDAIGVALDFVARHPDTLLVVTTDHGNANPGLNGIGARYTRSTECFERIAGIRSSHEAIHHALAANGATPSADEVIDVMRGHTGVTVSATEAEAIATARSGKPIAELNAQHRGLVGAVGQALANHVGIGWTGTSHTSELAITLATGRAREHFVGIRHHTDVFGVLTRLMGVEFENPVAT